ncbi:hypothetical protein M406DRAFT_46598 [Cryphonectria parasitica EP155]|uniref:Major facilitator superfamily (MFS) profile domain-containing protein n=1 Tax=Cryphonectria parasitica (strain ATCC 38755 / EP155) TaxID=660469 RepID=A0A9P4XXZ0_CRYP1|nr:uncharacterized protein M406DRAFT_46598 [Cryphonectria parasitica EP155]KAF3762835.1 hypothetical protein M406DRAFT_46598 [Cryphonectria parasitica EP155]
MVQLQAQVCVTILEVQNSYDSINKANYIDTANVNAANAGDGIPYSVYTPKQKLAIVLVASMASFLSPASTSAYFPALNAIGSDLGVSLQAMNWTITSYMILQGIAPSFFSSLTDMVGRRPCYFLCLGLYISANVALALQNNYFALLVLRCLQSTGSSATVLLGSAVIADIAATAERGTYYGYGLTTVALAPSIAPVLGGVITQYLGWRAVFWFLTIVAGIILICMILFYPETSRKVVGNGSLPPQKWNVPLFTFLTGAARQQKSSQRFDWRSMNPLRTVRLIFEKQTGVILAYTALGYAAFYFVTAAIPGTLARVYGLNDLQIGLCYIPLGAGSFLSTQMVGRAVDRNYRRLAMGLSYPIIRNRQDKLGSFPIERARLEIALPMAYAASAAILAYGWMVQARLHIAGPCVVLVVIGFCNTGTINVMSTLAMDVYPKSAATAAAAINLAKCLLGAAAAAVVQPLISALGYGWAYTVVAVIWSSASVLLLIPIRYGPKWRQEEMVVDRTQEGGASR